MDLERLEGLIRDHGLEAHREAILATARPAILLRLGEAGQGMAGESRIGGIPDLPDSLPWPTDPRLGRNLTFLLQIDLAALPAFPGNPLPGEGMLYLSRMRTWTIRSSSSSTPGASPCGHGRRRPARRS
jgi:hypothetical protein